MKIWIAVPVAALLLAGCSIISVDKSAATLDRNSAIAELEGKIEEVGFNRVSLQPGVDEFLHISASLLERQYHVMGEYRTQAEHHVDVQAFLYAYRGRTAEELQAGVFEFDATATTEAEKIGPKIASYRQSIKTISDQNFQLGVEIVQGLATAGLILAEHSQEVAVSAGLGMMSSFLNGDGRTADNDLGLALMRAKEQLDLAYAANKLISLEQETIAALDSLQADLEAKG